METAVEVDRAQVLAYRIAAQGLDHASGSARVGQLAVLDLGVQDSSAGSVKLALAARLPDLPPDDLAAGDDVDDGLSLAWTHRGAPHLHRTADLPSMAAANWPRNDADAAARLGWQRARLAEAGVAGRDAFDESAAAVHDVVAEQMLDGNGGYTAMTKGAVSTAVTAKVSPGLSPYCRPCGCHHISEQLLRLTALPGGVRLEPVPAPLLLAPLPDWPWPPAETGRHRHVDQHLPAPARSGDPRRRRWLPRHQPRRAHRELARRRGRGARRRPKDVAPGRLRRRAPRRRAVACGATVAAVRPAAAGARP